MQEEEVRQQQQAAELEARKAHQKQQAEELEQVTQLLDRERQDIENRRGVVSQMEESLGFKTSSSGAKKRRAIVEVAAAPVDAAPVDATQASVAAENSNSNWLEIAQQLGQPTAPSQRLELMSQLSGDGVAESIQEEDEGGDEGDEEDAADSNALGLNL